MSRDRSDRGNDIEAPPPQLAADPDRFWKSPADLASIAAFPEKDTIPVLKLLGPLPFPRAGFPVMGFLATLYEHVASCARVALDGQETNPPIRE